MMKLGVGNCGAIRFLTGLVFVALASGTVLAQQGSECVGGACASSIKTPEFRPMGPPPVVWPWGMEVKFPWKEITGVWTAGHDSSAQYYIFKTVGSSKSGRELDITLYDPKSCSTVATGTGYEDNSSHIVTALMVNQYGHYEMSVHAFDPDTVQDFCDRASVEDNSVVMVAHIYSPDNSDTTGVNYQLRQINTSVQPICSR